ncbi:MAG: UDP-N-acetylmuramate--L-alanine ligase, partial [bacterium]
EWKPSQSGRIIAVFQPHRYTRTLHLGDSFENAFDSADITVITDVYAAGEDPIPGVSGELIYKAVMRSGKSGVHYLPTKDGVLEFLTREAAEDDLVLTLGAGDIWKTGESFVRYLEAR